MAPRFFPRGSAVEGGSGARASLPSSAAFLLISGVSLNLSVPVSSLKGTVILTTMTTHTLLGHKEHEMAWHKGSMSVSCECRRCLAPDAHLQLCGQEPPEHG